MLQAFFHGRVDLMEAGALDVRCEAPTGELAGHDIAVGLPEASQTR